MPLNPPHSPRDPKVDYYYESIKKKQAIGESGAGLVKLTLNCNFDLINIEINPTIVKCIIGDEDDQIAADMLAEFVKSAHYDASCKIKEIIQNEIEIMLR